MGVTDERDTPTGCSEETPVATLGLSEATAAGLQSAGITYVGQILALAPGDLTRVAHLASQQIDELRASLIEHGCMERIRPLGPFSAQA